MTPCRESLTAARVTVPVMVTRSRAASSVESRRVVDPSFERPATVNGDVLVPLVAG